MSKATEGTFGTLHGLVADILIEQISAYRAGKMVDESGAPLPIPPALLAQAIKLMKDNGIDTPVREGNKIDTLKQAMPDFDELEAGHNIIPMRKA